MTQFGTDQRPVKAPKGSAAQLLVENRDLILDHWLARITSSMDVARREARPVLIDTLPNFLMNIAQALSPQDPRGLATEGSSVAQEHGGERARLTNFTPEDILKEYQVLRDTIIYVLQEKTVLADQERAVISRSIDQAMVEAMSSYFLVLTNLRYRFSLFISDELKRPLSAISAKANLILKSPDDQKEVAGRALTIAREVKAINIMIQELLDSDLVKNSEKLKLRLTKSDLFPELKRWVSDLDRRFGQRFQLDGGPVIGYWNLNAIRSAVENLCVNALTYGDDGPVKIRMEEDRGRCLISVHNAGKSIPVNRQEFIFQSFRRRESMSTEARGWGVGLPLVRGVAEAHGGSVGLDSSPEKGTTFTMDIQVDSRPYQPKLKLTPGTDDPAALFS